jgi:hypothetical protein
MRIRGRTQVNEDLKIIQSRRKRREEIEKWLKPQYVEDKRAEEVDAFGYDFTSVAKRVYTPQTINNTAIYGKWENDIEKVKTPEQLFIDYGKQYTALPHPSFEQLQRQQVELVQHELQTLKDSMKEQMKAALRPPLLVPPQETPQVDKCKWAGNHIGAFADFTLPRRNHSAGRAKEQHRDTLEQVLRQTEQVTLQVIKRNLREWPTCQRGGQVTVRWENAGEKPNAYTQQKAKWACDCYNK